MSSNWSKAKQLLGMMPALFAPSSDDHDSPPSDAAILSPATVPSPPQSPLLTLFKSSSRSSSKKTCSICLASMEPGDGHAIFTAECSHSFHFQCIASNVKHGNQGCPICRAEWKQLPTLEPSLNDRQRMTAPLDNTFITAIRRPPISPRPNPNRQVFPSYPQPPEPATFNDDESLDHQLQTKPSDTQSSRKVKIETFPEVPEVPQTQSRDNFTVLINIKAPKNLQTSRAPIDLVTVLDVSGSMSGTKLALLKRAMGFVIQNLSPNDRLSVVAFSSIARRLFPLRRMSDSGKQQSVQAVNSLTANGGTNIAEALRKGVKVMEDRKESNPVGSLILLSDGQDTYTLPSSGGTMENYQLLLPQSVYGNDSSARSVIPVHTFGFGTDHDASLMHSIADISGGTFSFIETESVIQDAFAQCIGGLLSVVVKGLQVSIECLHAINFLRAGSYRNRITADRLTGSIEIGDLYAEEERDFLVSVTVPAEATMSETSLLKVRSVYTDPLTKNTITVEGEEVKIHRPETVTQEMVVSIEVDRQRNRLEAAEAMARAKTKAEQGDLGGAASILESCRKLLASSVSAKSNDKLCIALDAELREMQERVGSRNVYEASGRAYILSGISSHSWQRATARGDSTSGSSLVQSYQTPSMVEMLGRSQATTLLAAPSTAQRSPRPR